MATYAPEPSVSRKEPPVDRPLQMDATEEVLHPLVFLRESRTDGALLGCAVVSQHLAAMPTNADPNSELYID